MRKSTTNFVSHSNVSLIHKNQDFNYFVCFINLFAILLLTFNDIYHHKLQLKKCRVSLTIANTVATVGV